MITIDIKNIRASDNATNGWDCDIVLHSDEGYYGTGEITMVVSDISGDAVPCGPDISSWISAGLESCIRRCAQIDGKSTRDLLDKLEITARNEIKRSRVEPSAAE